MGSFLTKNAALLIAILGLLLTVIVQWEVIIKRFEIFIGGFHRFPLVFFRLLAISASGTVVASVFWIIIDFLTLGKLSLNVVLFDIASGAAWGIPLALFGGSLSKSLAGVVVSSVLISVIILVISGPEKIIVPPESNLTLRQIYSIVLFLLVANIGVACGFAGFRTGSFIDGISRKE